MKRIVFLDPAKAEMADAAQYYEAQADGLGFDFLAEVERAIEHMSKRSQSQDRFSEVGYGEDLSGGFPSVFSIASMRKKPSSLRSCTYVGGRIIGLKGSSF